MYKPFCMLASYAILSPVFAFAGGEGDNSPVQQMQYADYNYIHNIADGSLNPVSANDIPLSSLAIIKAGYFLREGDYRNVDASRHKAGLNVDAYGISRMDRVAFEGGVSYYNYTGKDRCWNTTLFQNPLNPFILADSEPSNYDTERFHVYGRVSYRLTPSVRLGINADYNVGVMSDETDPRAETKGMRFIINPGVAWDITGRLTLGATAGLNLFSESTNYTCLQTAVNYPFYLMSGLGTYYPQNGNSYIRDAKGTSWFASIDATYRFSDTMTDRLTLYYGNESEGANDGGSTFQFKGGDYTNTVLRITDRFSITGPRHAHNIELMAETNDVNGRWYDQRSYSDNGTTGFEVMNSSIKHKETYTRMSGSYRFDLLDTDGVPSLTAAAGAAYTSSDTWNYPQRYFRKYTLLDLSANVMKHFSIRNVRLGIGIDGAYRMSPSSSCDFVGLELEQTYTMPMYAYLTSAAVSGGATVKANIPVGRFILGAYITGGMTKCTDAKIKYDGTSAKHITCGLSMAF